MWNDICKEANKQCVQKKRENDSDLTASKFDVCLRDRRMDGWSKLGRQLVTSLSDGDAKPSPLIQFHGSKSV